MAYRQLTYPLGVLIVCIVSSSSSTRTPKDVPLPYVCKQSFGPGQGILINESVVLTDNGLSIDKECNLTLATARSDNRVLINILGFKFGQTCDNGSLEIFDYKTQDSITGELCGISLNTSIFQSETHALSLLITPGTNSSLETMFQIILTSFNIGTGGTCGDNEFQCANKLCIAKDLYCNGYNECSDSSDEPGSCGMIVTDDSVPIYLYVIVALAIATVAAVGAFVVYKVMKRRMLRDYDSI